MQKIKLDPLFLIYCALAVFFGKTKILLWTVCALSLHEAAHCIAARRRGFAANTLRITPLGATLSYECGLPDSDAFFVASAAPFLNLAVSLFITAMWWLFPQIYTFTYDFCRINFALGIYNLLPVFPFDGGRMIMSVLKNKMRGIKALRITGFVCGTAFTAFGVVSLFHTPYYSLFIAACALFQSVFFDAKNEKYRLLFDNLHICKDLTKPYEKRIIYVNGSAKLSSLLHKLSGNDEFTVCVVDDSLKTVRTVKGADVNYLFFGDRQKSVSEAISTRLSLPR
jgi:stage IV sporulation protein FB